MKDSSKLDPGFTTTTTPTGVAVKDSDYAGSSPTPAAEPRSLLDRFSSAFKSINKLFLFYTGIIFFNHFAFGVSVNIVGPTLVDLRFIYGVSLNTASMLVVANNVGYTCGALAGYLYLWINRQIALIIFTLFISLTTLFFAHNGSAFLIFATISLNGVGCGAWDAANTVWLVEMWPVGATAVLQAAQFSYGAGMALAPRLAGPYVYGEANFTEDGTPVTTELRKESLIVPFLITGLLQSIAPVFFFILYLTHKYEKEDPEAGSSQVSSGAISSKVDLNNNYHHEVAHQEPTDDQMNPEVPWRKTKLTLCGLCLASYFSSENGYLYYCTAMFQYLEIHLSASESSEVTWVLSLAYTLGPLVTAFVSLQLPPDPIISYHFVFLITGWSLIYFFRDNLTIIYAGSAILGYGFSAMVPAINSFTERHFKFSDTVAALYTCVCGLMSLSIPILLGNYFEDFPLLLMYMVIGFIIISLAFFVLLRLWITLYH